MEELKADKWDETHPLIRGKKAEDCNLLIGFICHLYSHSFSDLVRVFVRVCVAYILHLSFLQSSGCYPLLSFLTCNNDNNRDF